MRWRRYAGVILAFAVACEGAGGDCAGCDTVSPYPEPPPSGGELQDGVVVAHLTQGALDFLSDNVTALLGELLVIDGDLARYDIPPETFDPTGPLVVREGSYVAFSLANLREGLSLTWLPDDDQGRPGLRFLMEDAQLFMDLQFALASNIDFLPPTACRIRDAGQLAAISLAKLGFELRLAVDDSGPVPTLTAITDQVIIDLGSTSDDTVFAMDVIACDGSGTGETCTDATCALAEADCPEVCGLVNLFTQLGGFVAQVLQPAMDDLAPSLANIVSGVLIDALAGIPLGVETELPLAALLGSTFGHAAPLNVKAAATDGGSVVGDNAGRGLQLGLTGGAAATPAPCVVNAAPPDFASLVGPAPSYSGFVGVFDGTSTGLEGYHVALSLSEALLAQASWSAFQGGMLCFNLGAEDVETLGGGAISFTAGLLLSFDARLTGLTNPAAPMLATVLATEPPVFRLGAGAEVSPDEFNPLIEVTLNDLMLGIYMLIDDSQLRVAELATDVRIGLDLERLPAGALQAVIRNLELVQVDTVYNELAPEADISGLLELLIDLAVTAFLGDSLNFEFDLSDSLGGALGIPVTLRLGGFQRDVGPTGANFLSLFATLCDEADEANPSHPACYTPPLAQLRASSPLSASLVEPSALYRPTDPATHPPERFTALPSGRALLSVDGGPLFSEPYEYQVRVDGGPWGAFFGAENHRINVESPRLLIIGHHRIEVRGRPQNRPQWLATAEPVELSMNRERPVLSATESASGIDIAAHDIGAGNRVTLHARSHRGGQAGPWLPTGNRVVLGEGEQLEVVGRDPAGNLSTPLWLGATADANAAHDGSVPTTTGCAASSAAGLPTLLPLWFWLRRRRHRV